MEKRKSRLSIYLYTKVQTHSGLILRIFITCIIFLLVGSCRVVRFNKNTRFVTDRYLSEDYLPNGSKWEIILYSDSTFMECNYTGIWYGNYIITQTATGKAELRRCSKDELGLSVCKTDTSKYGISECPNVKMYDYMGNLLKCHFLYIMDKYKNVLYSYRINKDTGIANVVIPPESYYIEMYCSNNPVPTYATYEGYCMNGVIFKLSPNFAIPLQFSANKDTLYYIPPDIVDEQKKDPFKLIRKVCDVHE